jgi:4-hydroxy-tetrahydrodipicolinate synthase
MPQANYTTAELKAALAEGLIPAMPVMFDRDGRFHEGAHEAYVAFMSSQPIAGAAIWAHTGRGLLLGDETARVVMQQWRQGLPNKPLIAGAGAQLSMAAAAAEYGADALLVYPPTWLRDHERRDSLIVEHHKRLAEVGLPLVLFYLYEAAGGVSYTKEVLDELLALPNVIGIKMATLDSVMTYQDVARHVQSAHPDKLLITGEDRFLGYSLRRGAQAALIGMGAVCTELQAELMRAHFQHRAERFLELSDLVDQLAEALFIHPMEGYIGRILFALSKLGVIPFEAANDPWGPALSPHELENITNALNVFCHKEAQKAQMVSADF